VALEHPAYVNNSNLVKTINFNQMARTEADHIVSYMRDNHGNHWYLNDPDGHLVHLGSTCFTYSYAIARAGHYINPDNDYTDLYEEGYEGLWQDLQYPYNLECPFIGESGNAHPMAMTLAAISNSWRDHIGANANNTTPDQILANGDFNANTDGCNYIASHIGWDVFYGALWDVFHGGSRYISDLCRAKEILNSAPSDGPYFHDASDNAFPGWCATRRFYDGVIPDANNVYHQRADVGKPSFEGNYNGLDYMLLFNLYYLDSELQQQGSANASPLYLDDYLPINIADLSNLSNYITYGSTNFPSTLDYASAPIIFNSLAIVASGYWASDPGHFTIKAGPQGALFTNTTVEYGAYLNVTTDCIPPQSSWYFDPSMFQRIANPNLNIDENVSSDVTLFPNPSTTSITITLPPLENTEPLIQIYNSQGKIVFQEKNISKQNVTVVVSEFAPGIYFVRITDDNTVFIKKFIRE
jgi:hypothetical protein